MYMVGLGILEAISPLPLCLSGGDQMMPQGIIRNSLGDASRHHQGVKGFNRLQFGFHRSSNWFQNYVPDLVCDKFS